MARKKSETKNQESKAENQPVSECNDTKCLLHKGNLSLRGAKHEGIVVSDKMQKSAIVEIPFYRIISKYRRYEKRKTRITVHNPQCISAKLNDKVVIAECRPLSKTKNFIIIEKLNKGGTA